MSAPIVVCEWPYGCSEPAVTYLGEQGDYLVCQRHKDEGDRNYETAVARLAEQRAARDPIDDGGWDGSEAQLYHELYKRRNQPGVAQPGDLRAPDPINQEVERFKSFPPDHQPQRRWALGWAEELQCETGVYNRRWRAETPWFSIRVHHWLHSDDSRHVHDHPWNFYTFIVKGSYVDVSPRGEERVKSGHLYYRAAEHRHWVKLDRGECWTIIFTGPKARRWGFWVNGKFMKSFKFFYRFGRHVCD